MTDLQQTLFIWAVGFIVGYLSKKSNFNVTINFKKDEDN